jgi:hypothetical protein
MTAPPGRTPRMRSSRRVLRPGSSACCMLFTIACTVAE